MARFFDIPQNTPEWYSARAGIATASQFNRLVTASGQISSQAEQYAYECVAEIFTGEPIEQNFFSRAMERGVNLEQDAISAYKFLCNSQDIRHGGFFTDETISYGASPDVRIYENDELVGVAEIKCPLEPTHIKFFMMEGVINPEYHAQVQGHLLVTGAEWCDWFSYHPRLPFAYVRTYKDEKYQNALIEALSKFREIIEKAKNLIEERGFEIPGIDRSFMKKFEIIGERNE